MQGIASGVQSYMKQATELVERYRRCSAVAYVSGVRAYSWDSYRLRACNFRGFQQASGKCTGYYSAWAPYSADVEPRSR
jgi:hypothetical protein